MVVTALITGALGTGCKGTPGPAGSDGAQGPALGAAFSGKVQSATGLVGAGVPVVISLVDLDGKAVAPVGSAVTDSAGHYSAVAAGFRSATTSLVLEATLSSNNKLHAFLSGSTQDITPVTEGVYQLIGQIVGTPGGRGVVDFSPAEVAQLAQSGATALQTAGTDLTNLDAVRTQLLTSLATQLTAAAGGAIAYVAPHAWQDPTGTQVAGADTTVLEDGAEEQYNIFSDGEVYSPNGLDWGFDLAIGTSGLSSSNFDNVATSDIHLEDGRQVVLGPITNWNGSGLDVTRKIYVPSDGSFVRAVDIFSNPGGSDITGVGAFTDHCWDFYTPQTGATFTSSGDQFVDPSDFWFVDSGGPGSPAVAFLTPGANSLDKWYSCLDVSWSNFTVAAGTTQTVIYWALQDTHTDSPANLASFLGSIGTHPPASMYKGMTSAELQASVVPVILPDVTGEAGSVMPGATVTVTNTTTADVEVVTARTDGSFSSYVPASSGNTLTVSIPGGNPVNLVVRDPQR